MAKRKVKNIRRVEPAEEKAPKMSLTAGETAMTVLPAEVESVPLTDGFQICVNGLVVDGSPSFEDCERAGLTLVVAEKGAQFAIGDFVNYVEDRFGEQSAQIIDPGSGWSLKTVKQYAWLAKSIAPDIRRMDKLGVRHHMLVVTLSPGKQREWLNRAADPLDGDEPWTVSRMAKAMLAGGDVPESAWWVQVLASSAEDQQALMQELMAKGRTVKALARRGKGSGA